jgi:quinol monooxygenase YgiN
MVKVVAKKLIMNESVAKVIKLYEELVTETRKEVGCIKYELFQDINNSSILAVIEEWEDIEALEKHKNSEHIKRIVPQILEYTIKNEIDVYHKVI